MKHPINYMRFVTIPITLKIRKATAFTNTTLAPAGVEYKNETVIPIKKQATEIIPDEIMTLLKLLNTRIEVKAGKIIKLEINIVPIIRIPRTIVIAVKNAINILYSSPLHLWPLQNSHQMWSQKYDHKK